MPNHLEAGEKIYRLRYALLTAEKATDYWYFVKSMQETIVEIQQTEKYEEEKVIQD